MKFWLVDAFTNSKFAGNPAGVFLVSEFPQKKLMQNIAGELNFSQTAFVKKLEDAQYHIRWFTPNSEAPLCGHATIASVNVLLEKKLEQSKKIKFYSISGDILAEVQDDGWVSLCFPRYKPESVNLTPELRAIVNEEPIYTGFSEHCFFMELENISALKRLNPDLNLLMQLPCRALIATAQTNNFELAEYDFASRYFAPKVGIIEDPVCGSAHCRLIPYWSEKLNKNEMIAYQASKRGGVIKCVDMEEKNKVKICGQAVIIFEGKFLL